MPALTLHAMESTQAMLVAEVTDAQKLADVYKHRTKSVYYDSNHVRREFSNPLLMREELVQAFRRHNLNTCLGLLAKSVPLLYTPFHSNNIFLEALDADYAPFCQFLIDEKIYSINMLDGNGHTLLERSLYLRCPSVAHLFIERGELARLKKAKPTASLFAYPLNNICTYEFPQKPTDQIFQLLTKHGQNINELLSDSKGMYYFVDRIPCYPINAQLQELLPILMKHGLQPELCTNDGASLLYRIKKRYLANIFLNNKKIKNEYVTAFAELICLVALHHERAVEQHAIYTLLATHTLRKDSCIAWLPKDVLHSILIPHVRTFKIGTYRICAQQQCNYLAQLLKVKPLKNQDEYPESRRRQQANTAMLELLDPEKVDQHYDQLTHQTLMFIAQKKCIRKNKNKVS